MSRFIIITLLLAVLAQPVAVQSKSKLDAICNSEVNAEIKKGKSGKTAIARLSEEILSLKVYGRFSRATDGCLVFVEGFLQNRWFIYDLYNTLLDRGVALFYCDKKGVNNVRLDAAQRYIGKLMDTSYSRFADNAEGGPPATLKSPDKPYRRARCRKIFNRRIKELTQ